MEKFADWLWYQHPWAGWLLSPLALLFYLISRRKRQQFLHHPPVPLNVPIIVVGNISVGGTGKTPLLIALIELLKQQGYKPGVVSRGYGGKAANYPYSLTANSTALEAGDEPLLIYQRCHCPVVVDPKRLQAAHYLIEHHDVDVILSDDGLQHYALERDIEIAVIDGKRGLGNRLCLPAGPLRETAKRLNSVDFVLINGDSQWQLRHDQHVFQVEAQAAQPLHKAAQQPLDKSIHAVAGIGNPQRFFATIAALGYAFTPHVFNDHHNFSAEDVQFDDDKAVLMTEKDAVKCRQFLQLNRHWYLPVSAKLPLAFEQAFLQQLRQVRKG